MMDSFSLSPDCQHSATGLCSKCTLNQTFSISKAEERHRRNLSNGSIKLNQSVSNTSAPMHHLYLAPDEFVVSNGLVFDFRIVCNFSFPKLPVQAVQPQTDDVASYLLSRFFSVPFLFYIQSRTFFFLAYSHINFPC
ncbi:hypothetical protein NECAME_02699, partial [Necator americanus]